MFGIAPYSPLLPQLILAAQVPASPPQAVAAPIASQSSWLEQSLDTSTVASAAELLHGTMGALTLAAAVLASPALARVASHPLFALCSLGLGVYFQTQTAGHTEGALTSALLFVSVISTTINAYAFYRGIKSAWDTISSTSRLASYDLARDLLQELRLCLEKVKTEWPSYSLEEAKRLVNETVNRVLEAEQHFTDLHDERPQRIEAARQSSLRAAAPKRAAASPHQEVHQKQQAARNEADNFANQAMNSALKISPMLAVICNPADEESNDHLLDALDLVRQIQELLTASATGAGNWDRITKLRKSERHHLRYVSQATVHAEEAQRVASESPRNWMSEARGDPSYSPLARFIGHWLGEYVNPAMTYGSSCLATIYLFAGIYEYTTGFMSHDELRRHVIQSFLCYTPAAIIYLYNARQMSRRFNASPAPHQDVPFERFGDEAAQATTVLRLDTATPPLPPGVTARYLAMTKAKAESIASDYHDLEAIDIPRPESRRGSYTIKGNEQFLNQRRFTPMIRPNPTRPFRYDHRPGRRDTEQRKAIRMRIKAMTIEELETCIRNGDVTHIDLFNMIRNHPVAQEGAVIPRPISGKLERELLRLAKEADRLGIIRHFVAVKDLFPGIDGVLTAGSKTVYLTDLGKSPLVERLVALGFIPVPTGMTAGANGGTGSDNGHGAVGNPKQAEYDTGGSSSSGAVLLGMSDFIIRLAIGSDTAGSISAPCGSVHLYGWVPEKGWHSRVNMIPFASYLDTPGVMGVARDEVLALAQALTVHGYQDQFAQEVRTPVAYVFEEDIQHVSEVSQKNFWNQVDEIRAKGIPVMILGRDFSTYRRLSLDLFDMTFAAVAMSLMNPWQENRWGEPSRYVLDRRLQVRLAKAKIFLETRDDKYGTLFNRYLHLQARFRDLISRKFPTGAVFLTPTPEAVSLDEFHPNGLLGEKLDGHDTLGGMLKNHLGDALLVDPDRRLTIQGKTGSVLAIAIGTTGTIEEATTRNSDWRSLNPGTSVS